MGCSPFRDNDSSRTITQSRRVVRISSVADLRIDATSFVSPGKGTLFENYNIQETLSTGLFGIIRRALHNSTKQQRVIKSFKKSILIQGSLNFNQFFREIEVLRQTDHPNIVKVFEFFEDAKHYHLVSEYIEGGEFFDFIIKSGKLSEAMAAHFLRQLLTALVYCHSKKIVHRDLKPENLLMNQQSGDAILKVIGFGLSTILDTNHNIPQRLGSALYVAPEIYERNYTEKCDIWSCGVILYILLSGKPPFAGRNHKEIYSKAKAASFTLKTEEWNSVSQNAKVLIGKMIDSNPKSRISASEAIQDEWIRENTHLNPMDLGNISLLNNIQNFHVNQKMQNAVLAFISSQIQVKEDAKSLIEIFSAIDVNGDGKISEEELIEAYAKKLGRKEAVDQVSSIMAQVDTNNSGFIDYSEFLVASSKLEDLLNHRYLVAAFVAFDRDGNGKINARELNEILGKNMNVDENVWQEMIDQVDMNSDGLLDFNEFKLMMKKLL